MKSSKQLLLFVKVTSCLVVLTGFLVSCGNPYIHKQAALGNGVTTLTLDGSRRAIITKNTVEWDRLDNNGTAVPIEKIFVCAEPAPDALGTLAATFAAEGSYKTVSAETNATINTDVVKLFNRSQGIQALRDGMYRLCEARANSAISDDVYAQQIRLLTATLNFVIPVEVCSTMTTNSTEGLAAYQTCVGSAEKIAMSMHLSEQVFEDLLPILSKAEDGGQLTPDERQKVDTLKKIFERE